MQDLTFCSRGAPSAFNTADKALAEQRAILDEQPASATVKCTTLQNILERHYPENTAIDFLTADVECMDLKVLMEFGIYAFMLEKDYECIAWLRPSLVFKDTNTLEISDRAVLES